MLSDGRLLSRPLVKVGCERCGLLSHACAPDAAEVAAYFRDGYGLYAHEPGRAAERARQSAYADWILASIETEGVREVLEAGCGNGSLLLELGRLLPAARLRGVEPSAAAAQQARIAGVLAQEGSAEELAAGLFGQDLVLSVNVIEHSIDPVRFLASLAAMARDGGQIVVVCPDGTRPSSELLFFDHLFSFTPSALARLAGRSRLAVKRSSEAPASLGPFRLYVLSKETKESVPLPTSSSLATARAAYLRAWQGLDEELLTRTAGASFVTCFGAGEAALLLRAYAPRAWGRVRRVSVDRPVDEAFCGLPVEDPGELEVSRGEVLLLGVRPRDQAALAERLARTWEKVVRWDDLVAS